MPENTDDFLAHYGVVGMKWGKRSGSFKDRVKGAALDSAQRRATTNREIASGRGQMRDYNRTTLHNVTGLVTGNSQKAAGKRATKIEASIKRIESGKPKARDIVMAVGTTNVADLFVSRKDKRGLPGAVQKKQTAGRTKVNAILGGGSAAMLIK